MGEYGFIFFIGLIFLSSAIGSMTTPSVGCMVFGSGLMVIALISVILERKRK
jgi:hypothetical protein